jgi:hypothetical protein
MKTILQATVIVFFFFFSFSGSAHAQSGGDKPVPVKPGNTVGERSQQGPAGIPPNYVLYKGYLVPRAAVEAYQSNAGRPQSIPATYTTHRGYLVPRAAVEAQQRSDGRPPAGPRSEEEKRRVMLEQLEKYKALGQARKTKGS